MKHETQPNPPNEAPFKGNVFSDRRFRIFFLFLINFLNTKTMEGKNESKHTPEQLAEIWVFEHAHDAFGLSVQDGFIAGYNVGAHDLKGQIEELEKENQRLTKSLIFRSK